MRTQLLYNPSLLLGRVAEIVAGRARIRKLRGTPAASLKLGHIDSMELLELAHPSPRVIFDIGANVGTWSMLARAMHPDAQIHAFEPLVTHHDAFRKNTSSIGVHLHAVALGAEAARRHIHVTSSTDASSFLPLTEAGRSTWRLEERSTSALEIVSLDDWVIEHGIPYPDLIKMDVQGFELEVLRGAPKCLDSAQTVISEVSFREFYRGQAMFSDIVCLLAAAGFRTHAFGATATTGKPIDQCDVLFVRT